MSDIMYANITYRPSCVFILLNTDVLVMRRKYINDVLILVYHSVYYQGNIVFD